MAPQTDHGASPTDRPPGLSPSRGLVGLVRRFPVTSLTLFASVTLFLAVFDYDRDHPGDRLGGLSHYGAVSTLQRVSEKQLYGQLQLWGGDWWRVFVTGFHHADIFHLLSNAVGLVYLGRILEARIGSWRMLVFLGFATPVSLIPPLLFGDAVVGLSGGIYAVFGLLFVMRRDDAVLQYHVPDRLVQIAFLWIPIGMVLSATGVMPISNLGHAAGLAYGLLAGWVFVPPYGWRKWRWAGPGFLAAHLLIIPAFDLAMHPFWNGRYHWYLATEPDLDLADRIAHLHKAVERNRQLAGAWRMLAGCYQQQNKPDKMWESLFTGLKYNRSDKKLAELASYYWRRLPSSQPSALRQLRDVFGDDADTWREQLGMVEFVAVAAKRKSPKTRIIDLSDPATYLTPSFPLNVVPQSLTAPSVNPDDPHSATEGRRL